MSVLQDSFFIVGALLVFVIAAVTAGLIFSAFNSTVQASSDIPSVAKTNIGSLNTAWGPTMDWFFAAFLFGLPMAAMGLAYFNRVPAVFFYLTIAVMLLMLFVGAGIETGWINIMADSTTFSAYASAQMPLTNFVMGHFLMYGVLIVAIIGWGTHVKTRQGTGYGG